jgi:RecB family exonuclease
VPITLLSGPANAGKAQAVLETVRAHIARGEQPLLVVPTRADVDRYVRELAGEGTLMGARVMRFEGLLYEVVRRAGLGGEVVAGRARERLLARAAREAGLAEAGDEPLAPGLARAARELIAELHVARVSPARFTRALADWAEREPARHEGRPELGRLYSTYEKELGRLGRPDLQQRVVAALDELRRRPALWGQTPVAIYGFDDLSALQLDAVESLGRAVDTPVTVSLSFEPGRSAFAGRATTYAVLSPLAEERHTLAPRREYYAPSARGALAHLERSLFEPDAPRVSSDGAIVLLEGGGERAELELVAKEIARLIDEGMAPEEIALAVRNPEPVAESLEEVLTAAGVPYALQRRRRLADSAIGRALIGLLRSVPRGAAAGVGRGAGHPRAEGAGAEPRPAEGSGADLLAWLRAPGMLQAPALADGLERDARRRGLESAAELRELWERRHWKLEAIDRLAEAQGRSPEAVIERASRELGWLLAAPRRHSASVLSGPEADEARAYTAARRALEELGELAQRAAELVPGDAWGLALELESVEFVGGEPPAAGRVAVSDPLALRARRVRALFLCGLQEGVFPARRRRQGLLSEEERRGLAEASGLRLGEHEDLLAAERYLLYAAVSRPEELLVLSWHTADDDGSPRTRSLFVEDICDLFEEQLLEHPRRRALGAGDAEPDRAAAPLPPDAGLSDVRVLAELAQRTWSPSQLENLISCPVRWYVERVLRPGAYDPEAEPLTRGGLAHAVLNDTLEGLRERTGSAALTIASLPLARDLLRDALAAREQEFPLSAAPERVPGARLRLRSELERYLEYAAGAEGELVPGPLELAFGFPPGTEEDGDGDEAAGDSDEAGGDGDEAAGDGDEAGGDPLPAFDLGGDVRLRGRIDRVDLAPSGDAVVVDYKARNVTAPARWISDGKVQVALYMLAVESLLGIPAAGGFYQPLSGPNLRARGVLDQDTGIELDCVRGDARPHEEVRELLDEALDLARSAALAARRGELQPRPQTCSPNGCSYPSICRCQP